MTFQLSEEPIETLSEYASVPIAFEYKTILELTIVNQGLGGFIFTERDLDVTNLKDYDSIEGAGPLSWARRFDVSNWALIVARSNQQRIGGAVIAFDTPGVDMFEGRNDLAVLWDIRVHPAFRHCGVGTALFQEVEQWSADRKCSQLKIETQNINLNACKFYARHGCTLGSVNRLAYPNLPDEIQLNWYKDLSRQTGDKAAGSERY